MTTIDVNDVLRLTKGKFSAHRDGHQLHLGPFTINDELEIQANTVKGVDNIPNKGNRCVVMVHDNHIDIDCYVPLRLRPIFQTASHTGVLIPPLTVDEFGVIKDSIGSLYDPKNSSGEFVAFSFLDGLSYIATPHPNINNRYIVLSPNLVKSVADWLSTCSIVDELEEEL